MPNYAKEPVNFDYYELEGVIDGGPDITEDEEEKLDQSQFGIPNDVLKLVNFQKIEPQSPMSNNLPLSFLLDK